MPRLSDLGRGERWRGTRARELSLGVVSSLTLAGRHLSAVSQPTPVLPRGIFVSSPKAPPGLFHIAENPRDGDGDAVSGRAWFTFATSSREAAFLGRTLSSGLEPVALVSSTRPGGGHHI